MARAAGNSRLAVTIDLHAPGRHVGDVMLKWSDNANPLGHYPIPIISLKGGSGPTLLVLGGAHGDEFEGPAAIMRLAATLSHHDLAGQLILMPALNAPALGVSSRVSPLDGVNLNRAFPGDADGGPTSALAHYIESVLMPRCDAVIDLHSGGKASWFAPCALATRTADTQLSAQNDALACAFGLPLIWVLGENNDDRSVNAAAERAGVPMIAAELGGGGGVDPDVTDLAERGLRQCMQHLDMIPGDLPSHTTPHRVTLAASQDTLFAPSDGLFDRKFSAGQHVKANQTAGTLHFPLEPARTAQQLTFPRSGFVLAHCTRGIVARGEMLALVVQSLPKGQ